METEKVRVVGRLKTMEVLPQRQLDVNVGVGADTHLGARLIVQLLHCWFYVNK